MSRVRKSVHLIIAANYSTVIIQVLSISILACLLTPARIGILSVAAVAVSLTHTVRDFSVPPFHLALAD